MKNIFLFILTVIIYNNSTAQAEKANIPLNNCVSYLQPFITYEFEGFNFHQTNHKCERGFWFSFKGATCRQYPVNQNSSSCKAFISDKDHVIIVIEFMETAIRFHFPAALTNLQSYSANDSAFFNIDEPLEVEITTHKIKFIQADYPVKLLSDELIIDVNYEKINPFLAHS